MMQVIGTVILLGVFIAGVYLYARTCSLEREIREVMAAGRAKGNGQSASAGAGGRADG